MSKEHTKNVPAEQDKQTAGRMVIETRNGLEDTVDSHKLKRRRDSQQWILDLMVKQTGREQNFAYDQRRLPAEVKSYAMIPRAIHKLAAHRESIARAAESRGYRETARQLYYCAVEHYHSAQHAIFADDNDDKIFLYERLVACYDRIIELSPYPMERVEIPWEGVTIQGILHLVPGRLRGPAVLFVPGMDMVKEVMADPDRNPFIDRGMHMLVIDGPGQGISNIRKIRVTADNYERAASAAITYLSNRPEVDKDKIAVAGNSMGSYWGHRLAAYDSRVKAVATGAACYGGKREIFEMASPRFKQMFMYMSGIHDEREFDKMTAMMHLKGYGAKTHCACLMSIGEYDPLSPMDETLALFEELAGPKELWIFEDDFHSSGKGAGGMKHLGGLSLYPFLADWLKTALEGRLPANLNRKVLIHPSYGAGPYGPEGKEFISLRSKHPASATVEGRL